MGAYAHQDGRKVKQGGATGLPLFDQNYTHYDASGNVINDAPFGEYTTALDKHRPGYMMYGKAKVGEFKFNGMVFSTDVFNRHFEYGKGRENYLSTHRTFIEGLYDKIFENENYITIKASSDINRNEYQPMEQGDSEKLPFNIVWNDRRFQTGLDAGIKFNDMMFLTTGIEYTFTELGPNQRIDGLNADVSSNKKSETAYVVQEGENFQPGDTILVGTSRSGYWFDPYLEDHQVGGYAMLETKITDKISTTAGTRIDYNGQRGGDPINLNPRAAIIYMPKDETALKILYNRGYLRPANFQAAGNDSIKSETMDQVDLVWFQEMGNLTATTTLYWQQLKDFININSGLSGGFANSGNYNSKGVELELVGSWDAVEFWANGYYSIAEADGFQEGAKYNLKRVDRDGKLLSFPKWAGNFGGSVELLNGDLYLSPSVNVLAPTKYRIAPAINKEEDHEGNYKETDLNVLLNLAASYSVNEDLELQVGVNNVLDNINRQPVTIWNSDVEQYGRFLYSKISYGF